jgi:hypothetical protein
MWAHPEDFGGPVSVTRWSPAQAITCAGAGNAGGVVVTSRRRRGLDVGAMRGTQVARVVS